MCIRDSNIAAGLLTMAMYQLTLMTPHFPFVAALVLIAALLALTVIDFDTQLLPDDITLPLLWICLLYTSRCV